MVTYNNNNQLLVAFGELVLRLHSSNNKRFLQATQYDVYYGGAEANTCVLLARLGMHTSYISRVPDNDIAQAGIQQLRSQGVGVDDIVFGGDILGLYFTEPGNMVRPSRVIYDRSASSYATLQPGMINWKEVFSNAYCFHWSGVSAAISQGAADVCAEALAAAHEKGLLISADFNYRSTLWNYGKAANEVMPSLLKYAHVAVADLDSTNVYFGVETAENISLENRFQQCSKALLDKLPNLQTLGMTFRRTNGIQHIYSAALLHKGEYFFSAVYELPFVTDQIGSGDAFTAGLLYGLMNQMQPQQIVDFAIACGALKQSVTGDWAIIHKTEIEAFIKSGSSGRIIR